MTLSPLTSRAFDPDHVVAALARCLPARRPLPLHEPRFDGREWEYVKDCLDTGWVSSVGSYVDRFEQAIADLCGVPHAVAVVNGTAALHMCLLLSGVQPGDEVLVPALTFVATANAVRHCGAVPHFIDSAAAGFGLDPRALAARLEAVAVRREGGVFNRESGRPLRAVMPMHVFGMAADMDGIAAVAATWDLAVVEDAAEALGARWRDRPLGSFGPLAAMSFNGNKVITTGGGGAILTTDTARAKRAKHLTTTAKLSHPWRFDHDAVAYNYRLPNLNAALGCAQIERLPALLAAKQRQAARYHAHLAGLPGLELVTAPPDCGGTVWLNAVLVPGAAERDALLAACHRDGILARPAWELMHRLPIFADCPRGPLPVAEALEARLVCLPSSPALGDEGPDAKVTAPWAEPLAEANAPRTLESFP